MNAVLRYIDTFRHFEVEEPCLPDWYIRQVLGDPPAGEKAVLEAAYSAQLLEGDREASRG